MTLIHIQPRAGQWPSERLGQQFIIENRPCSDGNIGAEAVVHAPLDGYTLLVYPTPPTQVHCSIPALSSSALGHSLPI